MAVREIPKNTWRVEVKYKGKWIHRKTYKDCTKTYAEAIEAAALAHAKRGGTSKNFKAPQNLERGVYQPYHLGALLEKKIDQSWHKTSSGNTSIRNAKLCLTLLQNGFYTDVNSLSRAMLNQLVLDIREHKENTGRTLKISDATMNRYLAALSALVSLAEEEDILTVKRPKFPRFRESEGRQRIFLKREQEDQYEYLKLYEHYRLGALIRLCYETGARSGELRGLNLRTDIIDNKVWHIQRTAERTETKTFNTRMIPLTEKAYEIIKELKERYPNETEPFRRYTSSQVARCFRRMREHLGFSEDKEYVLHSIRHTVATKLLAQGNDIFKVAEWCGHSNLETTRRYLKMIHVFREDFADSMIEINKR